MIAERHITLCVTCSPKFEEVTELDAGKPFGRIRCACCGTYIECEHEKPLKMGGRPVPRIKFRLASDADGRSVDCKSFRRLPGGSAVCDILNHPWCVARGSAGPEGCSFRQPREQQKREGEAAGGGRHSKD